ncbi:MAG: hypothetical protein JWQ90_675 [Hydrocarboniphaga sp.]|uniref:Isoquinoline 1-oxidoreductase subunit n=1 Tax=Hydrocarboniphaga sp. TaxID=2033016 RepID=UPI002603D59D|nr:Isoquinoline 1-oxidoreductase subunit [Hydrocarboniphaga sp.]MDB5968225.1 hypothetical protein [Hydrocarboniphaga sp.]
MFKGLRQGLLGLLLSALSLSTTLAAADQVQTLKSPRDFAGISDKTERSRALFTEAGKVIQHPRCMNCHPKGDSPTQGLDLHPHLPHVVRGPDNHGATALQCNTCHQAQNFEASGVPGHPLWHVAPIEMAWQGQSLAQICEQIKDKKRNGGKSMKQLEDHMAKDSLVGWAWNPGIDISRQPREPAPGTQAQFGALIGEWISTGAACPV